MRNNSSCHFLRLLHTATLSAVLMLMTVLSGCKSSRHVVSGSSASRFGTAESTVTLAYTTELGKRLVKEAHRWLDTPYRYGGHTRGIGTDCSGMVMEVYDKTLGIALPRNSAEQCRFATDIKRDRLRLGDLIFFATGNKNNVSHVGIYIGDGKMIHASSSRGVMISKLDETYWMNSYVTSGRILADSKASVGKKSVERTVRRDNKVNLDPIDVPENLQIRSTDINYEILDTLLEQKLDSVYSSFLD